MENNIEINQQSWEKVANKYAEVFLPMTIYFESYERFFSKVKLNTTVLDIGCGPGIIAKYVSEYRADLSYTGIDYAESMIEIAKEHFPQFHFEQKDARELSRITEKFDAITIGFCIPYLTEDQIHPFFASCKEKLNECGLLYVSFVPKTETETKELVGSTGDKMFFTYFDKNWLLLQLKNAGFELLEECIVSYERNGEVDEHLVLLLTSIY